MENKLSEQQIAGLVRELGVLARRWRTLHMNGQMELASQAVTTYHQVMSQLWANQWKGDDLLPEEELPTDLMPAYYRDYWHR